MSTRQALVQIQDQVDDLKTKLEASEQENYSLKNRISELNRLRNEQRGKIEELSNQQNILLRKESSPGEHARVQELIGYIEKQRDIYKNNVEELLGKLGTSKVTRARSDSTDSTSSSVKEVRRETVTTSSKRVTIKSRPQSLERNNDLKILKEIQNDSRKILNQLTTSSRARVADSPTRSQIIIDLENSYRPSPYRDTSSKNSRSAEPDSSSSGSVSGQGHSQEVIELKREKVDMERRLNHHIRKLEGQVESLEAKLRDRDHEMRENLDTIRRQVCPNS